STATPYGYAPTFAKCTARVVRSTMAIWSAWLRATASIRWSDVTARPMGQPSPDDGPGPGGWSISDAGFASSFWAVPPLVGGSVMGARSTAWPLRGSTVKTWMASPPLPVVGPVG